MTLNVATFSWLVLSKLQFAPTNSAFYWYALEHLHTISKCHQHTHAPAIQYATPYLSLTWCLPFWFASEGLAHFPCLHQNQPFSSLNCSHHCSLVLWRFCSPVSSENNLRVSIPVHWEERKVTLLHDAFSPFNTALSPLAQLALQKRNRHAAGSALAFAFTISESRKLKDRRVTHVLQQESLVISSWQLSDNYTWGFVAFHTFPKALGPGFPEWLGQDKCDEDTEGALSSTVEQGGKKQ